METKTYDPCSECGASDIAILYEDDELGDAGAFTLICGECSHEMYVPAETTARTRIAAIRKIVTEHSAARVDGYIVDAFTASMLLTVYEALTPANREKFGKPNLLKLVDLGWIHPAG